MATNKGQGNGVDPDMMKALEKLAGLVGDEEVDPSLRESLKHVAAGLGTDSARRAQRGSHSSSGSDSGSSRSRGRRGRSRTRRRRGSGSTGSRGSLSSGSRSRSRSSGSRSRSRSSGSLSGSRSRSRSTGSRSSYSRSPSEGSRSRSRSSSASSRSSYSDEWRGPRGSPGRSTGSRPGAAVAVRRPTPYELWASAHMVVKKKNNLTSKKLTNKEWQGIVQRLNDTTRQRHARLLQEQNQVIADEMKSLSFAPHICERSREYAQRVEPLHARLGELERKKRAKLDKWRQEDSAKKMRRATFQPNLAAPCVCGVSMGLQDSHEMGMLEEHSNFCLKFMKACATINNRNQSQKLSSKMKRSVDHLTQYDEYKRIRAQQRQQIMEEVENRELTFTPQINPNSYALARRFKAKKQTENQRKAAQLKKKADALARGQRVLPSNRDKGHEQETFTPKINRRSRRTKKNPAGNIYERMYREGKLKERAKLLRSQAADLEARGEVERAQRMQEFASEPERLLAPNGVTVTKSNASVASAWSAAQPDAPLLPPSPKKTSALSRGKGKFNTVVFEPTKHAFIVRRLQSQARKLGLE